MSCRGKNWTKDAVDLILTHVESVLPLGASAREKVEAAYNRAAEGHLHRHVASVRLKFTTLKNVRKPTGDPTCPPAAIRAKRIQRLIDSAASVATLDGDVSNCDADASNCHTSNGYEQPGDGDDYLVLALVTLGHPVWAHNLGMVLGDGFDDVVFTHVGSHK